MSFAFVFVPLTIIALYGLYRLNVAVIKAEKSQYDDSDCPPGYTKYGGPM